MKNKNGVTAFARCTQGSSCKFEIASAEPGGLAIAFVDAAYRRHALEAHGVRMARP